MPVTKGDIVEVWDEMKSFCGGKWSKTQSKKVCMKAAHTMTKELMEKGSNITGANVASAANVVDVECSKYSKDNRRVCVRAVSSFIRRLARRKPGLQGRR